MDTIEDTMFALLYPRVARELNALGFIRSDLPSESPVTWPQVIADWCIWTKQNYGPFLTAYCEDIPATVTGFIELGEPTGTLTIHGALIDRTIVFKSNHKLNLVATECKYAA